MQFYVRSLMACLAFAVILTGCGSHNDKPGPPTYIIYSPNAEPLNGGVLGRPMCEQAMSAWFDRLALANGGVIARSVFLSDAQIQFSRMDIDHNGYLVSAELDRFRAPYRQESLRPMEPAADEAQGQGHKHKGSSSKSHKDGTSDASLLDPVMSADTNLDFKVTPDEFMKQAESVFDHLDTNHDNLLERAEVMTRCPLPK